MENSDGKATLLSADVKNLIAKNIFLDEFDRIEGVKASKGRFVHYTSAEVATYILKSKSVWMRNANAMNDFREIEYGWHCLCHAYPASKKMIENAFEDKFPGLCKWIEAFFDENIAHLRFGTYLTCISEHLANEDTYGRLSMWRAYGGRNGVAIVMNSKPFVSPSDALSAYTLPVAYLSKEAFSDRFSARMQRVVNIASQLHLLGEDYIKTIFQQLFASLILGTKHPGFAEEREWRIYYVPIFKPSDKIEMDSVVVKGVPQIIHKIKLQNYPDEGFTGADPLELIDRIIVGPTEHPFRIKEAIATILSEMQFDDPFNRVIVSDIPLRNWG